jgi:dTDP-4-amino-4,6-dideoxygalactose transaminase
VTSKPIFVTQPFLPELAEFLPYLERIWQSRHLTNGGPFHQEFERVLADYLGVEHVSLFTNGTLALLTALQALGVGGEVITTPFSFVATSHVLAWNRARPVFVDIDPETFNIDANKIEAAITPQTTAILPVHVYGRPCDVERIGEIAARHNLRVIYDAAHAFGVTTAGAPLFAQGDMSVLSFHATKVFNTFEGGAIVSASAEMKLHVDRLKNFGIADEVTVIETGINGKMNEFQAALGVLQLKHVGDAIAGRRRIHDHYRAALADLPGIVLPKEINSANDNYAYFPIRVTAEYGLSRDALHARLAEQDIFARRYFYPLISEFPMYRDLASAAPDRLPHARRIAQEILCLPIYPDLAPEDATRIAQFIRARGL